MKSAQDVAERWNRAAARAARNWTTSPQWQPVYTTASEDREMYARGEIDLAEFTARIARRLSAELAAEIRRVSA